MRPLLFIASFAFAIVANFAFADGKRASSDEATAAALISQFRAEHGMGAVKPDPDLSRLARSQASAMAAAGVLSHSVAGDFASRIRSAGILYAPAAENIGAGFYSLRSVLESWKNSPGHRENLLLSGATRIGLARADAPGKSYGVYWALVIAGAPRQAPVARPGIFQSGPLPLPFGIGILVGQ